MVIDVRGRVEGGIIHGDHGTHFTCLTFTHQARSAELLPSLGSVGNLSENAVAQAFRARMRVELLHRQRWGTRVQRANAIFEYIEGFHNRQRHHSFLDWESPVEIQRNHALPPAGCSTASP